MWDEHKGRRFEMLRTLEKTLTEVERAELAKLTSKLDGHDTAFTDADTKLNQRPRRPEEHCSHSHSERKPSLFRMATRYVFAGFMVVVLGGAGFGFFAYDFEPAPVCTRELVMLVWAAIVAPVGLFAGFIIACLVLPALSEPDATDTITVRERGA